MFSLVTGFLEKRETPEQAVVREVKEELGLDGQVREFIGCYSLFEKNQIILAQWLTATGELKTGNEISEIRLLSREELKLWEFGRLVLTSIIVGDWLEKTTSNKPPHPTPPLRHGGRND
jgi:ADP-ribose pyrophosphatase YjhB (NUDIX family)